MEVLNLMEILFIFFRDLHSVFHGGYTVVLSPIGWRHETVIFAPGNTAMQEAAQNHG